MSGDLLQTKLFIPPLRPNFVPRPRLIEQLNRGLQLGCKLTLISAPAGFGKTTIVLEWINQYATGEVQIPTASPFGPHPSRVAWVSLDKADNDPARFLTYLITALLKIGLNVSQPVQKLLNAPQLPDVETVITRLTNDISASPNPFLLVLDDYHVITETAIDQAVAFLVEQQPPPMHLVIATRQDPSLTLPRLRGRGQLTKLRQRDLRFTSEEAAAFLEQSICLNMNASEIAALEERTEGWIVGLQLAAVSMQRLEQRADISSFVDAFTGSNRHVLDYLVEEVLQQQTKSAQEFLLQTAILERLCGPLCAAVTGQEESQALLEQMEKENLFLIPLDDERRWYRYHHLFAELLQARLMDALPKQFAELHRRAAIWHEQNGFGADAIRHALATDDMILAAEIIEKAARSISTWSSTNIAALLDWINALPDDILRSRPWLRLFVSRAYYVTGRWALAGRLLKELEETLRETPEQEDTAQILKTVLADWASYAVVRGDVREAMEYANRLLADIPEGQPASRMRPLSILGMAYFRAGRLTEAGQAYSQAIDIALEVGGPARLAAAPLICNLAETLLLQGQLRRAEATCEEALEIGAVDGEPVPAAGFAWLILGKIRYEQNDLETAEQPILES